MLISLDWLREYVTIDVAPKQLVEDLTMLGLNVESLQHVPNPFAGLRIGRVLTCAKHPEADKLSVCTVDLGEGEARPIVCGAPNVRVGLEVAVIPAGESLPDGTLIKKTKIRGARSEGMICSETELGLGKDSGGIMELAFGAAPGTPLSAHLGSEDWLLNIEVTPNRPDQLGYLGVAREVAALYRRPLRLPDVEIPAAALAPMDPVPVEILDSAGCPRYVARRLASVKVAPSPPWLCRRLESMGLRPINNVVDVTNFVLFETGQPLHAFDAAKLAGGRLCVRRAAAGEKALTLEGKSVALGPEDLIIADAQGPVAIAGIMGCDNAKVDDQTASLVLESAYFEPRRIRGTRRRLDLATDSSYRFERGGDLDMVELASRRAAALLVMASGARAALSPDDYYPGKPAARRLSLRVKRVNLLLGTSLSAKEIADLLARLALPASVDGDSLQIVVPAFRRDLEQEIDLIEEIARLYGYDRMPAENRVRNSLHASIGPEERRQERCHTLLSGLGYQEVLTSSFMDAGVLDEMQLPQDDPRRQLVSVRNPLVSFNSMLRSSLLPGMLAALTTNFHRGQESLRLYQIGRVYLSRLGHKLPDEPIQLAVLITGDHQPRHWSLPAAAASLADLAGLVDAIAGESGDRVVCEYGQADPYYVPGACFRILMDGAAAGQGGLLRPALLRELKQKRDVFCLEWQRLPGFAAAKSGYRPLPAYPPSRRDLALLVPDSVRWQQVSAEIAAAGGKWLESQELFDVYRGPGIPAGAASCAIRLVFRSYEATLTDAQVDKQQARILERLKTSLKVTLRS